MKTTVSAFACAIIGLGCAHTSGGGDAAGPLERNEDGVPMVPVESFVSSYQAPPLTTVDPDAPSTWEVPGQYGLMLYAEVVDVGGTEMLAMAKPCDFRPGSGTTRRDCIDTYAHHRQTRLLERLEEVSGKKANPKAVNALPEATIVDRGAHGVAMLTLCDAACFAKAAELAGVEATLRGVRDTLNAKRQKENDKKALIEIDARRTKLFADLDSSRWQGGQPWWFRFSSRLVPYIDGDLALVGVAKVTPGEGKRGPTLLKAATGRARAELSKAFETLITTRDVPGGRELITESELALYGSTMAASFETQAGEAWAMAVCDTPCMRETLKRAGLDWDLSVLSPGPVEVAKK